MEKQNVLGLIGGMGSHASASFYKSVLEKCPANSDQEYLEILIHNNSKISDRTNFILSQGDDPYPEILRSARILELSGANIITMICVTAHFFSNRLSTDLESANLINLLDVVSLHLKQNYKKLKSVGLIASTGVNKMKLWNETINRLGIEIVNLPEDLQESLFTDAIYGEEGVKKGYVVEPRKQLIRAGLELQKLGAEAILSSCSELPLVLNHADFEVPYIDSFEVFANHIIQISYTESIYR